MEKMMLVDDSSTIRRTLRAEEMVSVDCDLSATFELEGEPFAVSVLLCAVTV